MSTQRTVLLDLFRAAVKAVDPLEIIAPHLPSPPRGRTIVIGAGKASARMAEGCKDTPVDSAIVGMCTFVG